MDKKLSVSIEKDETKAVNLSVGAGIAIVGMWAIAATVTLILFFTIFKNIGSPSLPVEQVTVLAQTKLAVTAIGLIAIVGSPMIAVYSLTKHIIGKKD
ncbi:MAG: hypothetical protein ABIQ04_00040 [Candidatus Saccharimonadales bacterium]